MLRIFSVAISVSPHVCFILVEPRPLAVISLLAVQRELFCFGFWFFGDFICGVLLFMVIFVIYIKINIDIGKNKC